MTITNCTTKPGAQFVELLADLARNRRLPQATYRLQLHAGFTFAHVQQLIPYLHNLGISDGYMSPYLKARPGSTHGYDIVDFQTLNPDIGSVEDYSALVHTLQRHGMGQLLDIVPNHMGVLAGDNAWWRDVLEHGRASMYARFFDIDWQPPKAALRNKVLLPILGDSYGTVLEGQELRLLYEAGQFELHYYEHRLPIAPCTTTVILRPCLQTLQQHLGEDHLQTLELQSMITALDHLPPYTEQEPEQTARRYGEATLFKQRLAALEADCPEFRQELARVLQSLNGRKGTAHSFDALHDLLETQPYRLCSWRVASDEINYRRFFDINDLAALREEDPAVFEATHELIFDLIEAGGVTGLRIDHPDGLFDPVDYFQRLQRAYVQRRCRRLVPEQVESDNESLVQALMADYAAEFSHQPQALEARPLYVVVEKILEAHEHLPDTWPIYGTSGYDFLNQLNGLFVDPTHAEALRELYANFVGIRDVFADIRYRTKKLILETSMASELVSLGLQLDRLSETNRYWRDFTRNRITEALQEVIACFPVYRTYIRNEEAGVSATDRAVITTAVRQAQYRNPAVSPMVFDFLRDILLLRYPQDSTEPERHAQLRFVQKLQQVTGPAMAKGLEDTAFYRYTPLVSLNEVGGDPDRFGVSVQTFHHHNLTRRRHWPYTLLSTSTHDTKRSEDVRARLNVLSELPQQWRESLWRWHRLNQPHKTEVDGQRVPGRQEEYLLYQTLLGAYPLEPLTADSRVDFCRRIQAYMRKALREAKVHTSWIHPNSAYEAAVEGFVEAVLDDELSGAFLEEFYTLQRLVASCGIWNALAQTLLKLTSPGVPDIYQGCELWDFSLVDPDNRRGVDFTHRQHLLHHLQERCQGSAVERLDLVHDLLHSRKDGRIKLYLIWQALTFRRAHASVFLDGDYIPLTVEGDQHEHVCAFARVYDKNAILVLTPRLLTSLLSTAQEMPLGQAVWGDTRVILPTPLNGSGYRQLFTCETVNPVPIEGGTALPVAAVLGRFPVAILHRVGRID